MDRTRTFIITLLGDNGELVLLQISGELFAHSRPAISNWTGLWYPSVEWRRIGL